MNTIFDELGGTYSRKDGYLYPNITVPEENKEPIGKYGRMRRRYLENHRPALYSHLVFTGKLFSHLREIERTCHERMELLVRQMAEAEGVTEKLKAENQMEWVRRMNSIQNRTEEAVLQELIYE